MPLFWKSPTMRVVFTLAYHSVCLVRLVWHDQQSLTTGLFSSSDQHLKFMLQGKFALGSSESASLFHFHKNTKERIGHMRLMLLLLLLLQKKRASKAATRTTFCWSALIRFVWWIAFERQHFQWRVQLLVPCSIAPFRTRSRGHRVDKVRSKDNKHDPGFCKDLARERKELHQELPNKKPQHPPPLPPLQPAPVSLASFVSC